MSKCPFWSTSREKVECYKECPIIKNELGGQEDDKCIFQECNESNNINFSDIVKDDYDFLDLSMYDEEKKVNASY